MGLLLKAQANFPDVHNISLCVSAVSTVLI